MHADYVPNPLYDNNPFIEALPPMLSGKDLIRALAVIPPYSDSDRDRSTGERLQLLSSLCSGKTFLPFASGSPPNACGVVFSVGLPRVLALAAKIGVPVKPNR